MIDDIVVIIMSAFIANYKVENYPYLSSFIKGFLILLLGIIFLFMKDLINGKLTIEAIQKGLKIFLVGGFLLSLCFCFVEFITKK